MVKTIIDDIDGVVTTPGGSGVEIRSKVDFCASPSPPTRTLTTDTVLTNSDAGVILFAATGAPVRTATLPAASECGGQTFVFRSLTAAAHIITGSNDDAGNAVMKHDTVFGSITSTSGSNVTFAAAIGDSIAMTSDGLNFHIIANFGTKTLVNL